MKSKILRMIKNLLKKTLVIAVNYGITIVYDLFIFSRRMIVNP